MHRTASLMYADRPILVHHHLSGNVPAFRLNSDLYRTVISVECVSEWCLIFRTVSAKSSSIKV